MKKPLKSKALDRIRIALDQISGLEQLSTDSTEFRIWRRNTGLAIAYAFGKDSDQIREYDFISFFPESSSPSLDVVYSTREAGQRLQKYRNEKINSYVQGLLASSALLESLIYEIKEYWEDEDDEEVSAIPLADEGADKTKVFIVHGRDQGIRSEVARLIERLGLEAVILEEQPDEGRTIIEKFEEEAEESGFAVVLLSPDDEGRLRNSDSDLRARARQNVILELGYFAGALGRKHVCAIMKGNLEKPSDYDGVVYIPFDDSEGWKAKLVRELKASGFDIDANQVI